MPMPRSLHLGITVSILTISGAFAQDNQSTAAADVLATEKAPNTTAVGQTKPPSRDASPTSVMAIERLTQRQAAAAAITDKICIGCQPDPSATGALQEPSGQTQSPEKLGTKLEELRTMAPPRQQSDLDTVDLASAHRERAKSVEEKTDGLWQSWLVSVCEGCGDQKPVKALRYEEWPDRNTPIITGANEKGPTTQTRLSEGKVKSIRPQGRLEANLSPENVDSIRQMPRR